MSKLFSDLTAILATKPTMAIMVWVLEDEVIAAAATLREKFPEAEVRSLPRRGTRDDMLDERLLFEESKKRLVCPANFADAKPLVVVTTRFGQVTMKGTPCVSSFPSLIMNHMIHLDCESR